jgi:hypothetical protein
VNRITVLAAAVAAAFGVWALAPAAASNSLLLGSPTAVATPATDAKTCSSGYVHAVLSWGHKCLRSGQYCKVSGDREYHRYRFHCHTGGRLSRSASSGSSQPSGSCHPSYSPCLPIVADLNCADIPEAKKPITIRGSDPYRLDGDGDGQGCE